MSSALAPGIEDATGCATSEGIVDFRFLYQWEWLLIEVLVLGLAIAELIALRRSQRRDREAQPHAPVEGDQ